MVCVRFTPPFNKHIEQLLILMLDVTRAKKRTVTHHKGTHSILIKQYAKRSYDIDSPSLIHWESVFIRVVAQHPHSSPAGPWVPHGTTWYPHRIRLIVNGKVS